MDKEEKRKLFNEKMRAKYALNPEKYKNKITDSLKITKHNWYIANKQVIIAKQSIPNDCPCGGRYQKNNKKAHENSKKHQKYLEKLD